MDKQRTGGPRSSDLLTFLATLLAALGINGAAHWLRARAERKQRETEQQQQAERAADIMAKRQLGHEPSDVRTNLLVWITAGSAMFVVLLLIGLWLLWRFFASGPAEARGPISVLDNPQPQPPQPRLQADPQADWLVLRATQTARLNSYGVDPTSGAIHIPIEQAMQLIATRGLTSTNSTAPQATPAPRPTVGPPAPTPLPQPSTAPTASGGTP